MSEKTPTHTLKRGRPRKPGDACVAPTSPASSIPPELARFDELPDAAHVRLPIVAKLYACSPCTVWRGVKSGRIPAPVKLTENVTAWRVGDLRKALAARAS